LEDPPEKKHERCGATRAGTAGSEKGKKTRKEPTKEVRPGKSRLALEFGSQKWGVKH